MEISQRGIERIVAFEGKTEGKRSDGSYEAYLDTIAKPPVPTIYCGLTRGIKMGMVLTADECERLFHKELTIYENDVNESVTVNLTQPEFDACVSFTYNCGGGAFRKSIAPLINKGKKLLVPAAMARYCHCGGKVVRGLVNRRKAEGSWFLEHEETTDKSSPEPMPQRPEELIVPVTTATQKAATESGSFWATLAGLGAMTAKGISDAWSWLFSAASEVGTEAIKAKSSLTAWDALFTFLGANMGIISAAIVVGALGIVLVRKVAEKKAGLS